MRFICDIMLGRLARYLRMLGFDAAYGSPPLAAGPVAPPEDTPCFLTRRLKVPAYGRIIRIRSDNAKEQLQELRDTVSPHIDEDLFLSRCLDCNALLRETPREKVEGTVPEFIFHNNRLFKQCPLCRKVYWPGSHADAMKLLIEEVFTP